MNKHISSIFINDLLSRINIVDFISIRIALKKKGQYHYACCPFHKEKTPSFAVNEDKQFFYCFGCGVHGNIIDFLMQYEHKNFISCVKELSSISGISIPNHLNQKYKEIDYNLYKIMAQINNFYQKSLSNSVHAKNFLKKRGLNLSVIKKFSIGYAPCGWNNIEKYFGYKKEIKKILIDIGMLVSKNGYSYDRFRSRIMFPIRNQCGKIVAFGGRLLTSGIPKYLNSPTTKIFKKSMQLYGFHELYSNNLKFKYLIVVEGYMDVITLVQFGIYYTVASLGTTITSEHMRILFHSTDYVIFCYDGDYAGRKAAWRTLNVALPYMFDGRQIKFMFLPYGEDPDTLIRKKGKHVFEQKIKEAIPLSSFLFSFLIKKTDFSTYDGRIKLSTLALPLIKEIPGKIFRIYLRQELSKKIGILDDKKLENLFEKKEKNDFLHPFSNSKRTVIRMLIGLLIQNIQLAKVVPSLEKMKKYKIAGLSLFLEIVKICIQNPHCTTVKILTLYRNTPYKKYLEILSIWDHMIVKHKIERVFKDALISVYYLALEKKQEYLIMKERTKGLSVQERQKLWLLNVKISKK